MEKVRLEEEPVAARESLELEVLETDEGVDQVDSFLAQQRPSDCDERAQRSQHQQEPADAVLFI